MLETQKAVANCFRHLETCTDARKATCFLSDKLVVSLCRRFKFSKRSMRADFVLKIGTPNYDERKFITLCRRAKEPLPLQRVQLKYWPTKKKVA